MKAKRRQPKATQPTLAAGASLVPRDYRAFLADLKARIRAAQVRAALAVNRELIQLYWSIGRAIVHQQEQAGWGGKVIDRLARDIQDAFPGITGFSRTNVYRMRAFYLAYRPAAPIVPQPVGQLTGQRRPAKPTGTAAALERSETSIVPQPVRQSADEAVPQVVAQIPWGHNVILLERLDDPRQRLWYAQQATANGWSRTMLEHWIESDLYARQGQAVTNFQNTLPGPQSDLAQQLLKDPYNFDFLTLHAQAMERELEEGLLDHLTRFLLELGEGFAFVGRQVHLEVEGRDFYIDLLFYHLTLRCFVTIDLKAREFEPEFAGKMNFYLSAVDDRFRQEHDQPSIGLILCKKHSRVIAEYALRHLERPVGVARYVTKLTERLPKELAGRLPTVKEIEAELTQPDRGTRRRGHRGKESGRARQRG
jgi:predicted nuclease of restriction endonuclease-like (RecB) superfamily